METTDPISNDGAQKPENRIAMSVIRVVDITATQYDALPRREQMKYEQALPEEELRELEEARKRIKQRIALLFANVMDVPAVDWLVEGVVVRDGITLL